MNKMIDSLDYIQKQEPSPFLYNKILNKIENQQKRISKSEMIIWGIPSCLALGITLMLLFTKIDRKETKNLTTEMHLTEVYSLY